MPVLLKVRYSVQGKVHFYFICLQDRSRKFYPIPFLFFSKHSGGTQCVLLEERHRGELGIFPTQRAHEPATKYVTWL